MKALLLGCSSIAARRVLPALASLAAVEAVDAASRRGAAAAAGFTAGGGAAFDSPEDALARSDAALVWVSGENAAHDALARAALDSGRHVVVDKPAFADAAATESALAAATGRGAVLAEATVFLDHPRIEALSRAVAQSGPVTRAQAFFSIPPLDAGNFRYSAAAGGGVIADMGPYAAATCRFLFGAPPARLACSVLARTGDGVETAISIMAGFDGGASFVGHYGFDTEYQNWLNGAGPAMAFRLDRATTPPPDAALALELRRANAAETVDAPAGDTFAAFLARVIGAIDRGDGSALADAMLYDARFRDRLRDAAA